ncbi:MAG: tetratricopeptide repeat protein [Cyclobacteriaceae bacterium]
MNEGRILQLKQFIEEDENDLFSRYALGLEYKEQQPEEAIRQFERIIDIDPGYTPLYYHLAETYLETDQEEKARETYLSGIAILEKTDDHHALKELKNAYQNFLFEYD